MEANTVLGKVSVDNLGVILTHEHLHMEFDCVLQKPPAAFPSYPKTREETFLLKNLGLLRQYPYSSAYNCHLDDADTRDVMLQEILEFKAAGGQTIVENTVEGISRNISWLKDLSEQSGVNIIAGTGFYVACSQSETVLSMKLEQIHDTMLKELVEGVDQTGIKCGIIGEIGISWPIHPFEKRVIQAVAQLQQETQAPITFHPGRSPESPFEIMRIFCEAGGSAEDVIMSHLDRTFYKDESLLEFATAFNKTFTQFDLFGTECSYYQLQEEVDMLSDAQRIDKLKLLRDNGHLAQITVSHDLHTKHRLTAFGGHGYAHILKNIVPKMKIKGFTQEEIDTILMDNPKRWLSRGNF